MNLQEQFKAFQSSVVTSTPSDFNKSASFNKNDFFSKIDSVQIDSSFIEELRDASLIVPVQNAIISYLAIKYNCSVCTNDKHFKMIKAAEEKLQLAQRD